MRRKGSNRSQLHFLDMTNSCDCHHLITKTGFVFFAENQVVPVLLLLYIVVPALYKQFMHHVAQ